MSYKRNSKNWEGLAQNDAMWAVLTDPSKKNQQWDETSFFETGVKEINFVMAHLHSNGWQPPEGLALDFGCGVGRLTRALGEHFDEVIGIDVSPTMIKKAKQLNQPYPNLMFKLNQTSNLDLLTDKTLSFIYTSIVLQHIPVPAAMDFISAFLDKLQKGGILVFQLPIQDNRKLSLIAQIKEKLKIGEKLAALNLRKKYYMEMNVFDDNQIKKIIKTHDAVLLERPLTNHTLPNFNGQLAFLSEDDKIDFTSAMYIIKSC